TAVLVGLSLFVMAAAVLFTGSVSGALALLVVCWTFSRRLTGPGRRLARTVLTALPLAALAWVGFAAVGTEVATTSWSDLGGRLPIWRDTARIVGDFPLTGTGWNTCGIAMLAYQTTRPQVHVVEAHNEYLQVAAEGGLLVGLPVLIALVVFIREVRARFRQTEDDLRIHWLRVGAVAGLIALLTQSLVDFSLQMPGNAVLFALLAAIAVHRPPQPPEPAEGTTPCG
ncbi:MAG: O-antigen ligase family protein, partial [Gammaproteobacteria bacterium]|nr:O-antigen ligase family protein [Gammaproteobacteria bacterium]